MMFRAKYLKSFLIGLCFVQAVVIASGQQAEKPKKKLQPRLPPEECGILRPSALLEIRAENANARVGESVKLDVTITNTSDRDIFYGVPRQPGDFGLEVRDEAGRQVPQTFFDLSLSHFAARLPPGESIHFPVRLDNEFQLDKPGNYFVQATRSRGACVSDGLATSDAITISLFR
jgi:hypothetical protein